MPRTNIRPMNGAPAGWRSASRWLLGLMLACSVMALRAAAPGGADPQPPVPVFAGIGKPLQHIDVFDRDETGQFVFFVNQQKFLHLFSR